MWTRIRHYLVGVGLLLSGFLMGMNITVYILTHKFLDIPMIILIILAQGPIIAWFVEGKSYV